MDGGREMRCRRNEDNTVIVEMIDTARSSDRDIVLGQEHTTICEVVNALYDATKMLKQNIWEQRDRYSDCIKVIERLQKKLKRMNEKL